LRRAEIAVLSSNDNDIAIGIFKPDFAVIGTGVHGGLLDVQQACYVGGKGFFLNE
jgi:hypothetical protein